MQDGEQLKSCKAEPFHMKMFLFGRNSPIISFFLFCPGPVSGVSRHFPGSGTCQFVDPCLYFNVTDYSESLQDVDWSKGPAG